MESTVAAGAQIVAAIFALVTIWQARQMMKKMDEQYRASVAPAWEVHGRQASGKEMFDSPLTCDRHQVMLTFINTGGGPARNVSIIYTGRPGSSAPQEVGTGSPVTPYSLLPSKHHTIELNWKPGEPIDGRVTVTATSRLGEVVVREFAVVSGTTGARGWVRVTPAG